MNQDLLRKTQAYLYPRLHGVSQGYSHEVLSPQSLTQSCSISIRYNYKATQSLKLSFIVVNEISE